MKRRRATDAIARLLLRGFEAGEADDVLRDLHELAKDRGGVRGAAYFWTELLKYPAWRAWDGMRHARKRKLEPGGMGGGMDSLWGDVRYAARGLVRNPGFSAMAIVIMTLSMGAGTAVYSVVRGVLLEPLPVSEPERLVSVWLAPVEGDGRSRMTPGNVTDVAALDGVFTSVAAFGGHTGSLDREGEPVFLRGGAVTPAYFETLGVAPILGRSFREDEGASGGPAVVVLSHHVWQQMFGADPQIVGRTLLLDGTELEVIGVAPPGVYPTQATVSAEIPLTASNQDFFVPLRFSTEGWDNRRSHLLGTIGRLAPGMSPEAASAALATLGERLRATGPFNQNEKLILTSFSEEVVGDVRFALLTLLGSVLLVLIISVTNVGALFVLRADDRGPELSVRLALGAPRSRIIRQLVLESVAVVGMAALGSLFVARSGLALMQRLVPYQVPRLSDVSIDASAMAVTIGIGLVVATLFGLAPVILTGVAEPGSRGVRGRTHDRRQRRLQGTVIAVQAGLGVVVLAGAALFSRSYGELRSVDTGFSATDTWTMSVPTSLEALELIVEEVRKLPSVASAAVAYDHPLERNWGDGFLIEGVEPSGDQPTPSASLRPFGADFFATVGIEVVEGRVPDAVDMAGPVAYAVINETLRDRWFPTAPAVGSRVIVPTAQRMDGGDGVFEILGVVRNVRFLGPDQPASPALYVALSHFRAGATTLLVRPARPDADVLPGVRQAVRGFDPALAVQRAQRLGDVLDDLLARPRFNMVLLLSFGVMGLTLCGLGAYGLVGRVVVMRFREIGIRMALGAKRGEIMRSFMLSALYPMAAGTLVGLGVALALGRLVRAALFGVSPADPVSLVTSAAFVLGVGALAALAPTMRGSSVDPASTLRHE